MIYDLFQQGAATGQALPIDWLYDSLQAGKPESLPDEPQNIHRKKAEFENQEMMAGRQIGVAYYDPPEIHIPVHREQQVQAELSGNLQAAQLLEEHIMLHQQAAALVAAQQAQMQTPGPPGLSTQMGQQAQQQDLRTIRSIKTAGSVAPKAGVSA